MYPLYIILFILLTLLITASEKFTITEDMKNSLYTLIDNKKKTGILTVDPDTKTVKTTNKDASFVKLTADNLNIPDEKINVNINNGKLSNIEIKELAIDNPNNVNIQQFNKFSDTYMKRYGNMYPTPLWDDDYWVHNSVGSIQKSMQHGVSCINSSDNNSVYVPRIFWFSAWPGNRAGGKADADNRAFQFLPICNKISIG